MSNDLSNVVSLAIWGWALDTNAKITLGQARELAERVIGAMADNKVITTVEQLRSIPRKPLGSNGPLIMSIRDGVGDIFEGNDDGTWAMLESNGRMRCEEIALPAVVLYIPNA